ncbi:UBAP1-MVB12-associated (UMA)-domain containing protein 1 isoform X2 [Narcine bancroftii]|uniref:UBAP1-MVB12-associated (UMA)-domain containing protein 1 isoform X2 n=1 Tax=Narcine bancroftii TaxID=1343680 RepID=UPI003831DEC7
MVSNINQTAEFKIEPASEMLNLFGIRKNPELSKKTTTTEKEVDGFVILGETTKEKGVFQSHEPGNQSTSTWSGTIEGKTANLLLAHTGGTSAADQMNQTFKSFPASSELLSDVPFTLSPHILAIHASFQDLPAGLLLPNNMSENLASFGYDFTLENSVLRNS